MIVLQPQPLGFCLLQRFEEAIDLRQQARVITPSRPVETTRVELREKIPRAEAVSRHTEQRRCACREQSFPYLFAHLGSQWNFNRRV